MDWSAGLQQNGEASALKKLLPITYVLDYVGIPVEQGEGRLHAPCPFHSDHDPSFDVYPWHNGERWGCFVCGIGGDVLDLIQKLWPELTFTRAKEAAGNMLGLMRAQEWTAPRLVVGAPFNAARAHEMLQAGRNNRDGLVALGTWLEGRRAPYSAQWLNAVWDVVVMGNEILMPVYNRERELVAMKHRSLAGGSPLSTAGSKLTGVFYGEWLPQDHVGGTVITEGESDTWMASYIYKDHNVLGLSTGAGTRPFGVEAMRVPVSLMLDGDVAGHKGRAKWAAAYPEIHVIEVPDGYDVDMLNRVNS